ncbi:MAG: hypothetical protein K8R40_01035 [Anaerolineaceae bacterium]|nr:hypothetical protein [Anaerolineaceae bacterium]
MTQVDTYQGRLDGKQRNRLKRLLNMWYKPSELAEEIGMPVNHIYRVYIPLGCSHERDEMRHIWINGQEFRDWYIETYKKTKGTPGQAHCHTCKKSVHAINTETKQTPKGLVYEVGYCPNCGRRISRIITQK